jgi:16S rRNA processing protein RimM
LKKRPDYIVVGRFGRPRGVSGEIYLNPITDNPERFSKAGTFWIESGDGWEKLKIVSVRFLSGRLAAEIDGINNPEQATELVNEYLYIRESDLGELPEGSYYQFDLIGCRVFDSENSELGRICDIETYPANDVWVVEREEGKRYLFPAVGRFIEEIDIEKQIVVVNPPEGIFDSPDED